MKIPALAILVAGLSSIATAQSLPIIPKPAQEELLEGAFPITEATVIRFDSRVKAEAALLAEALKPVIGREIKLVDERLRIFHPSEIHLGLAEQPGAPGSYTLEANPKRIKIAGADAAGAWHGAQSLRQLIPVDGAANVPACRIVDGPKFAWRGLMLDVGRHYYEVGEIKQFLDLMALHKLNVFHWHLTDDQGWRIEIKKYPKLTEVGGWRASSPPYGNRNGSDGQRYGGFYTQDQIKEIVAYAAARHITVVPEIEMPGHAAAAITAYPELGNTDVPGFAPKVATTWGVHPYIFSPTDKTFAVLEDILTEVIGLFPGAFIHIGGDEAPKDQWKKSAQAQAIMKREGLKDEHELQSYFIRRIEKFLASKNRKLIGWDEIQEGGLPKTATMMVWRDEKWAKHALAQGNNVVMAPTSHTYFDYYQSPAKGELAKGVEFECIGGHLPIEKVYSYNPLGVATTEAQKKLVLGTQAQLWSEYFKTFDKVQYMAFPRAAALAEVAWTDPGRKDFADFSTRLQVMLKRYDAAKVKHGTVFIPPARAALAGAKVTSSLGCYENHWPELAYDGRADTFFWADRELKVDDHLTVELKSPATGGSITIPTGGPASKNGDALEQGVLEASKDGTSWQNLTAFADGKATASIPAGTRFLRLRVTKAQTNWLIVGEIAISNS